MPHTFECPCLTALNVAKFLPKFKCSCQVHNKSKKYFAMFMSKIKSSCQVHAKSQMLLPYLRHKQKFNAKVLALCHVHTTTQNFLKTVKSMKFVISNG